MDSKMCMRFVIVILMGFLSSCQGYKFFVGGKDGWVVNPSENYNHWAQRNRFQVNDTLFFKYNKGSDSVLVVNKDDYNKCNTANPIQSLEDGDSEFKFDHSGPFFFISGNNGSCQKDQKLITVVLAIRNTPHHAPTPLSPSPESSSLSPAPTPLSLSPESSSLSPAPTPLSPSPESSLSPAPTPLSPSPESSLSPAPTPLSSLSPAPTPLSPSPESSSLSPESGSPSNNPADTNSPAIAPAPNSSFSPAFTTSPVILVWGLSVVVSAIFGSFVGFI